MKNLHRRIEVLQSARDETCADCWERLISVVTTLHLALERAGAPEVVARRYIFHTENITDDERAFIDAALPLVQSEIEAANEIQMQWHHLRPCCENWFVRRGGTPAEY